MYVFCQPSQNARRFGFYCSVPKKNPQKEKNRSALFYIFWFGTGRLVVFVFWVYYSLSLVCRKTNDRDDSSSVEFVC